MWHNTSSQICKTCYSVSTAPHTRHQAKESTSLSNLQGTWWKPISNSSPSSMPQIATWVPKVSPAGSPHHSTASSFNLSYVNLLLSSRVISDIRKVNNNNKNFWKACGWFWFLFVFFSLVLEMDRTLPPPHPKLRRASSEMHCCKVVRNRYFSLGKK